MTFTSIGDLAQSALLRNQYQRLDRQLGTLTLELASGRKSDATLRTADPNGAIARLSRSAEGLGVTERGLAGASGFLEASQASLDRVAAALDGLVTGLVALQEQAGPVTADAVSTLARASLDDVTSALNGSFGGRYLFSGTAVDRPPLPSPGGIVADMVASMTGAGPVGDQWTEAQAFFAPGGAFETATYAGTTQSLQVPARPGVLIDYGAAIPGSGLDAVIAPLAFLAAADTLPLDPASADPDTFIGFAVELIQNAAVEAVAVRAALGRSEEAVETATVSVRTELSVLTRDMSDRAAVDPFETATRFEDLRLQLETLYAVTGRISALSFAAYMR